MDATGTMVHDDVFAGTSLSDASDQVLADVWDWCVIQGCRPVCQAGRLYLRTSQYGKFRYVLDLG